MCYEVVHMNASSNNTHILQKSETEKNCSSGTYIRCPRMHCNLQLTLMLQIFLDEFGNGRRLASDPILLSVKQSLYKG